MAAGVSLVLLSYSHRIFDTKNQLYEGRITQYINIFFCLIVVFHGDFVLVGRAGGFIRDLPPTHYCLFSTTATAAMRFLFTLRSLCIFRLSFSQNKILRTCIPHWHLLFSLATLSYYSYPLDELMKTVGRRASSVSLISSLMKRVK